MRILIIASFALLTGCGALTGDPGPPGTRGADGKDGAPGAMGSQGLPGKDSTVSGARIRAVYHVAADGAREMIGWYDSGLDTACRFGPTEDGKTRCVPVATGSGVTISYYSSPSCDDSSMLMTAPSVCPSGAYAYGSVYPVACEGPRIVIYKPGAAYTSEKVYTMSGGACVLYGGMKLNLQHVTRVDPATLVEATEEIE
jgi:hypothetical protein